VRGGDTMGKFQERIKTHEARIVAMSLPNMWVEEFKIDYTHAEDKDAVVREWFF